MNIVALVMSTGNELYCNLRHIQTSSAYVTYRFFNCIPEPIKYTKRQFVTQFVLPPLAAN